MNVYNTSMQILRSWQLRPLSAALALCALALAGCGKDTDNTSMGTFHMGERVQVGPIIYNVLESEWKPALTEGGRAPKNRFLFLRLTMTNSGGSPVTVPSFELIKPDGTRYQEVTEKMEGVNRWLGLFRSLEPSGTDEGYIIFDAPLGAYQLLLKDPDLASEAHATVEIPVQLE